ncbi:MAG: hypothetical protein ACU4EQ_07295 [Candidatus Nitrosoglobus sp.]|jgi:hypothetical protein
MTYVDFSKAATLSESNALLGFLNSVLTRCGPISVLLRIALIPLLMELAAQVGTSTAAVR